MLEEFSGMEKKPNVRTSQVPARSGTEVKKNPDTFGRYNRRRESTSNNGGKNEPNRKPNQSNKNGRFPDKRPRSRGQGYGGGNSETKVELGEWGPEYGSVFVPGSKKQNLNHLLNFTLTPRATAVGASGANGGRTRANHGNGHWLFATHKHKYNKEEFLQANCQFVVKAGVDYSPYLVDPDILVDWNSIEQVRFCGTEHVSCPICLDTPTAAKMTRCGHVYCWPCILHYLALSDKSWRKCPICFESVHRKDLKSVVMVENEPIRVGEDVTFYLMKRERDTLVTVPVAEDDIVRQNGTLLAVDQPLTAVVFSKLLQASHGRVKDILQKEREELEEAMRFVQGEPEVCFVEQALDILAEREKNEEETGADGDQLDKETQLTERMKTMSLSSEESGSVDGVEEHPVGEQEIVDEDQEEVVANVSPDDVEIESQVQGHKPFFFYQAADGQNVFLTALNLRMLETQFGSLSQSPLSVTGRVLEKEAGSMTRELRNRLRSLSHLPITAAFELLELDMSSLVSPDILDVFAGPLSERALRRDRRAREERRREKRISHEVGIQWGQRARPAKIRLDSQRHFPKCGEEEPIVTVPSLAEPNLAESRSQSLNSLASVGPEQEPEFPPLASSVSSQENTAGPSFAQMLKVGASSSLGRRARPVWPKANAQETSWPRAHPIDPSDVIDPDLAEYAVPAFQQSFSDAISQALEKVDFKLVEQDGNSKKKKKRKQKLLFASGMAFSAK